MLKILWLCFFVDTVYIFTDQIRYQQLLFQQHSWPACAVCLGRPPCHTTAVCSTLHQEPTLRAPDNISETASLHRCSAAQR